MSRFLAFVVEQTLSGNAPRIKETVIALEVFDKRSDFDPRTDSTVRTEASKLRARLADYYAEDGRDDLILITIPKGTYAPIFEERHRPPTKQLTPRGISGHTLAAGAALMTALCAWVFFYGFRRVAPVHRMSGFERVRIDPVTHMGDVDKAVISSDGKYLALATGVYGAQSLRIRQTVRAGGEIEIVPKSQIIVLGMAFSPDSSFLYYGLSQSNAPTTAMYRIPILGGKPEELVRNVHSPPALAPDGVQYAFIRESPAANESQLIIAATDSRPERVLLRRKLPDYLDYPTWSPEGAPLAVVDIPYFKNQARLVTVDVATGTESPLGQEHWHTLRYPRWSSDSRNLIASGRHRQDAKFHLWHISFPQGKIRQITHDLDQYVSVSRSTDDSKIFALQLKEIASLWVTPPDDFAKAKRIETGASLRMSSAWTPDGRVIYHRQAGEDSSILTASADAGNRRTLVSTGLNWAPTVCENGRWIVYNHQPATQRAQLWRMKPDGSERVLLAADTGVTEPHCAPSGDWVVFASTGGQRKWPMLMKVSLNGGTPVALDTGHSHHVAVSPNGKLIAAFHTPDGEGFQNLRTRVAIFSIDGGRPLRILRISRSVQDGVNLRWTPDSRSVMYVDHVNGESNIWMHPIQGGAPRRVTSLRGITIRHFDWSHDGRFLSVEQIARTSDVVSIENMPN